MRVASDCMKRRCDIGTSRAVFDVGDAVWLYNPKRRKGVSPKLSCDWEGPYLVLKRIHELFIPSGGHYSQLTLFGTNKLRREQYGVISK